MSDSLKRFIISHKLLTKFMFKAYRIKNCGASEKASKERKSLSLFKYTELTKDIPYSPEEWVIDNNLYGQAYSLKRYAGIKHDLQAYIEHGLFWGGMVHQDEYYWYVKKFITFSERRKVSIAKKGIEKKVICVGPYIHYAENLYDPETFKKLKKELGSVLLVFPSKSILNIQSKYNVDEFTEEVNRISKDFDSILVSLYYLDARNKSITSAYEEQGMKIVTSGNRYDHYFLDRQRTYMELADMTMSNEVGTHVGYCVHLNKPHYIFEQNLERVGTSTKELKRELTLYKSDEDVQRKKEKQEVIKAFSKYQMEISDKQRRVVDKYWGTSSVKSVEELRKLLT